MAELVTIVGEILEFVASALGTSRMGGSKRGTAPAIVGSIGGAVFGLFSGALIPVPIIGSLIASLLLGAGGAFIGAVAGERWVELVSLPRRTGTEQVDNWNGARPLTLLPADVDQSSGAFMDTAAIMHTLDLVITSDTAIAHLAGALGIPTWIALGYVPDWRWLLDRSDSPWYPSVRLFRQSTMGDWTSVFDEITHALDRDMNARNRTRF